MSIDKDGGPAFPGVDGQDGYGHMTRVLHSDGMAGYVTHNQGMTLWDYYAAAALQGMIAADGLSGINERVEHGGLIRGPRWHQPENVCDAVADIADAMLAERKKRGIGQ